MINYADDPYAEEPAMPQYGDRPYLVEYLNTYKAVPTVKFSDTNFPHCIPEETLCAVLHHLITPKPMKVTTRELMTRHLDPIMWDRHAGSYDIDDIILVLYRKKDGLFKRFLCFLLEDLSCPRDGDLRILRPIPEEYIKEEVVRELCYTNGLNGVMRYEHFCAANPRTSRELEYVIPSVTDAPLGISDPSIWGKRDTTKVEVRIRSAAPRVKFGDFFDNILVDDDNGFTKTELLNAIAGDPFVAACVWMGHHVLSNGHSSGPHGAGFGGNAISGLYGTGIYGTPVTTASLRSKELAVACLQHMGLYVEVHKSEYGGPPAIVAAPSGRSKSINHLLYDQWLKTRGSDLHERILLVGYPRGPRLLKMVSVLKCVPRLLGWLRAARIDLNDPVKHPEKLTEWIAEGDAMLAEASA